MTSPENQARSIFLTALEHAPEDWPAMLAEACSGNAELRAQVEALLAAHQALGSIHGGAETPTRTIEQPVLEGPGTQIGPYRLMEQIGEGGMGLVFVAEQHQPVRRKVALKVIKPGMDTRACVARFEAERQALALMDHPNIAKVLDAGATSSGRPYFVMELVKGTPITEYCDENRLSPRERLELFTHVCHAVQHAHQKGIIHRDIKPTNVLVASHDGQPVVKVIDFGVAKAIGQQLTDRTIYTAMTQMVGTPLYMSPEQAGMSSLDIDTRTDVYSLGVLLYELLTGTTPFDKNRLKQAAFDEIRRIIREEEPPKPSTRLSTLRSAERGLRNVKTTPHSELRIPNLQELDWIVMKALEKDRNRRYETANGFAMDVQRYLADEPVQACPPSAAYRVRKFARRNKAALATGTLVLAALVLGTVVSTWQAIRATKAEGLAQTRLQAEEQARREAEVARDGEAKQRRLAQNNAAEAEGQRRRAEENFGKARQAVDEYLTQITENELLSVPGLQPLREELLEAALKFYAEFTQERADDATLRQELASAHFRLGTIQRDLGNAEAAEAANREAIRLYEQLRDQGQASVELQAALATAYFFAGRYNDTVTLCQSAMQVEPQHAAVRSLLADTYNQLAVGPNEKKQNVATALKYHQQAFELRESLVRDFAENPRYLAQLGGTVNNLGFILEQQLRLVEALAMYQRGVDYSAQAYERVPHSILWGRWLCTGLRNAARMQVQLDRQDEALRTYERLVTVCRQRAFENPALGSLRGDLYQAYLALGQHQKQLGDAAEGARCFRLAREVLEQIPRETPDQLFELATVYAVLARPAESLAADEVDQAEYQHNADLALNTLEKAVEAGYQNDAVLKTSTDLDVLRGRDDFQELLATVQKLAEADRLVKASGSNAATKLTSHQQAADLLKRLDGAQPGGRMHRATLAATLHSIGVIQTGLKQFDEADKTLDEALKLRQERLNDQSDNPLAAVDILSTRAAIGQLQWERDRPADAHRLWQEIRTECQSLAANRVKDTRLQTGIVGIERSIGDKYGEIGLLELALAPAERGLKTGQLFEPVGDCRGAHVLAALGRLEEHRKLCQLIAAKWSRTSPAQTVWATSMNPLPVLEEKQLLELAERVIKSDLDSLWKFKAATAWYRAGQYDRALELMLPARDKVAASGGSACLHWYALVYAKLDQKEVAAKYFEEAETKYLKSAETSLSGAEKTAVKDAHGGAWWNWAEDQAARRLAWNELRGTVDLHDPWQHLIAARGYRTIGEVEKSEAELEAVVAAAPGQPDVLIARAKLIERWDEREPSTEADWSKAVELAGDNPLVLIQRGHWYAKHGQQQKADADFAKAAALAPHVAKAPFTAEAAEEYQQACAGHLGMPVEFTNSIGMKFRLIPAGEFMMGTPKEIAKKIAESSGASFLDHEPKVITDEPVPHPVLLTQPYYLGQFEVTRAQFRRFVEASGYRTELERNGRGGWAHFRGNWVGRPEHIWSTPGEWHLDDEEPVCHLTWRDAQAFCEWLSKMEGRRYVLPTEAQWEFACRAGTTEGTYAAGGETLADIAWTSELQGSSYDAERFRPQPVGRKRPNAFGLHDMLGNVWEICSDWYAAGPKQGELRIDPIGSASGDSPVIRGGAWYRSGAVFARSSGRAFLPDASSDAGIGFRMALKIDKSSMPARVRSLARSGSSAEAAWQQAVESAGDDPLPWIQRGRWYTERGQHEKADADFAKAAALTPDELNKFIEVGWWASTTLEGVSPLFSQPLVDSPAPMPELTPAAAPVVVSVQPHAQAVEFRDVPELKDAETAYAMTYVYAPEAKAVTLLVGGNCATELRLNGKLVYQWKTPLSAYNAERVAVLLRPGRNTLVARVSGKPLSFILRMADNRLDRGLELAQLGLWPEAIELLKPELAEGQRLNAHVWHLYSALLPATGDLTAYRELCDQVLKWMGDNPPSNTKVNVSHVCTLAPVPQTDIARLVQLVDEGVAGAKGASWAVDVQWRVYFRAGRYQEVLDRVGTGGMGRSALRALCWHHLGEANKAKAELQHAERDFIDKMRMGPEGPSTAKVFSSPHGLHDFAGAYVLLREARALIAPDTPPDDQALQALVARSRQQLEAADPRLLPFEIALISGAKNPQRWLDRGRARAILGQWELAQADFDKAAEIAPSDPEMLASRCLIYAELNRFDEAIADLVKLFEEPPDSAKAPAWLAARQRLFDELGQWPELFERLTELRPDDPNPWIGRARYHVATQPDQAIADLREAVARGYRDLQQLDADGGWQTLKSREDFQALVREIAQRNQDELVVLAKLEGHTGLVRGVAFLPGGEHLVSIGADKLVNVWALETRSVLSSFPVAAEGWLRDADVSTDGRRLAVVSNDGEMKGLAHVWDIQKQARLGEFSQDFMWTLRICFSPRGTHIVTSGTPARGVLWDLSTGQEQQRFKIEDTSNGNAVAFSPDGRLLALATVGRVHLFDVTSSALISTVRLPNNRYVEELTFSANGARLAIGQNGGHVSLIDVDSRQVIKTLKASESTVFRLQFLSGDRFVLATSLDGTVRIWDIQQANVISTAASKAGSSKELSVSPDGLFAVTAGGEDYDEASKKWKVTGDYALRLWQLPRSVWPAEPPGSSARLTDEP